MLNKDQIKVLFSIIRNARNDVCHHRRMGDSIKSNSKYTKQRMSKSDVVNALNDLKILLGYDDRFDVLFNRYSSFIKQFEVLV